MRPRLAPSSDTPGTGLAASCEWRARPHTACMSSAAPERSCAAARNGSPTAIGVAAPMRASVRSFPGWRNAVSSATSAPMLWPARCTRSRQAASTRAATQRAIAATSRARVARAAPMAGQVHREHREPLVREVARLPLPHAVVESRPVHEDDGGALGVERPPAGIGIGGVSLDDELHGLSARGVERAPRSSIRSSGCSRPIDRRTVPGVMPAAASAASSMRKCVVEAGWITSDFASPMFARCEKRRRPSMKRRPASRPPASSKERMALHPSG